MQLDKDQKQRILFICTEILASIAIILTIASMATPGWVYNESPAGYDSRSVYYHEWGVLTASISGYDKILDSSLTQNITVAQQGGYGGGFDAFPATQWAVAACLLCTSVALMLINLILIFFSQLQWLTNNLPLAHLGYSWKGTLLPHAYIITVLGFVVSVVAIIIFAYEFGGEYTVMGSMPIVEDKTVDVQVLIRVCPGGGRYSIGDCVIGPGYFLAIFSSLFGCLVLPLLIVIGALEEQEKVADDKANFKNYA